MKISLRSAYFWIFGVAVVGAAQEIYYAFFVKVADEKGWFVNAAERWDFFWSSVFAFMTSPLVSHCIAIIAGGVIASYFQRLFFRRQLRPVVNPLESDGSFHDTLYVSENSADQPFVETTGKPLSGAWTSAIKLADIARQQVLDLPAAQAIAEKMSREDELKYYCGILHKYGELHGIAPPTRTSELIPYKENRQLIFWNNGNQLDSIDEKGNGRFRYLHFKTNSTAKALDSLRAEMLGNSQNDASVKS